MSNSAKVITFRESVKRRGEASAHLKKPGDAVLVARGRPRLLMLSCPCGCGDHFPINLDPRAGPAWYLYGDVQHELSLYPSVWRKSDCRSHYVIWRNHVFLFGPRDWEFDSLIEKAERHRIAGSILACLPEKGLLQFFEIAKKIGAIPWDVLMIGRRLARAGQIREGIGPERGSFRRVHEE